MSRRHRRSTFEIGLKDLARELGVSPSTVARALAGNPRISAETSMRVHELAERRHYVPNRLAGSLRRAASKFVGLLVPDIQNLVYALSAKACASQLYAAGYQMLLEITSDDPDTELKQIRGLLGVRVQGVIIAPTPGMLSESRRLLAHVPCLEINRTVSVAERAVVPDDAAGIRAAVGHLHELGHTKIGFISTLPTMSNGRARQAGFHEASRALGTETRPEWLRLLAPQRAEGSRAVQAMMILPERPTALVVGSGELSFGVVEALKEMRVRMPRELSLVVYGDPEWGKLCTPPLTTIAVSYSALAQAAAEQMVGMLAAGEARRLNPSVPTFTLIPVQLIVRGSTAGPVQRGASCA